MVKAVLAGLGADNVQELDRWRFAAGRERWGRTWPSGRSGHLGRGGEGVCVLGALGTGGGGGTRCGLWGLGFARGKGDCSRTVGRLGTLHW